MVVAVRLTKETAEMMRSQQRKAAAAAAAKAASNTTSDQSRSSGTPPLAQSPGRRYAPPSPSSSSSSRNNKPSVAAAAASKAIVPARSPRRPLPTRANINSNSNHPHQTRQSKKKIQRHDPQHQLPVARHVPMQQSQSQIFQPSPARTHVSLPSPRPLPSPLAPHGHHHRHHHHPSQSASSLPNPSFGDEDFGRMLAGCIENMGSMGSIESVADLVHGIDRQQEGGSTSSSSSTAAAAHNRSSHYYMSSEKVEAASRAAAAVLAGENGAASAFSASPARGAAAASRLMDNTARDIMGSGSNESIVVSSPSGHSQEHSSSLSHPHSPESFLLDDSIDPKINLFSRSHSFTITPGVSDNNIQACYNPSPTSLDWEYTTMTMDQFFDDMTNTNNTTPGGHNTSLPVANNVVGREGSSGSGSGSFSSPLKRKSDVLLGSSDDSKESTSHDENKRSRSSLLYGNDSFAQHFGSAPLASFGVFGSLSNSSADLTDNNHGTTSSSSKKQPPIKTTILSPRNRLRSLQRSPLPPQAPQLSDDELMESSSEPNITNEHSHPSKGTLEHYDNALYNKLKHHHTTQVMASSSQGGTHHHNHHHTPPLLVPHDRTGNRLAIIRGSSKHHTDYQIDDLSSKTYTFYKFLREIYPALEGCTYLLPGLSRSRGLRKSSSRYSKEDSEMECTINVSKFGSFRLGHVPGMTMDQQSKLVKSDLTIAKQRVECAIYAFGGTVTRRQPKTQPNKPDKMSIFRTRNKDTLQASNSNSSSSTQATSNKKKSGQLSRSNSLARREKYEKRLRQQYFEHGNRLSWDVQANLSLTLNGAKTFDDDDLKRSDSNLSDTTGNSSKQGKNRCKKCGQIKQGHICPYSFSLQRNIGVMVYPSANAHVADEPGTLAPALCEMNNFISIKSGSFETSSDKEKSKVETSDKAKSNKSSSAVDDDIMSPFRRKTLLSSPTLTCKPIIADDKRSDEEDSRGDKAEGGDGGGEDLLFQPKMEITHDQYRAVTPKDASISKRDYKYPQVPLTFTQRKSMSDALFSLSKLVPKLMDECALVLTEARKRDEWDLAVAELMTQVVCVLHCSSGKDYSLEGLRRYLLTLGIVC